MLKIILKDGTELLNHPNLGMNLDTIEGIEETLQDVGYYELFIKEKGYRRVYKHEVEFIVPADAIDEYEDMYCEVCGGTACMC